jgi:hypothetical protein
MSDYVILDNTQAINITGGFSRVYGGTGSSGNPSLAFTSNYYQWRASFNAEYNAPSSTDTPNIFINNPKLLSKYKTVEIHYYRTQYSERSFGQQGIRADFYNSNGQNIGNIFNAFITAAGTQTTEQTVEVAIPDNATQIKFNVASNNDGSSSNTTCRVYSIILKHRKGAKLGELDCEVYKGETEITDIFLGETEIG